MKGTFYFLIKPKTQRYNNTKKVGDKELILNSEIYNHQYVSREAVIVGLPSELTLITALAGNSPVTSLGGPSPISRYLPPGCSPIFPREAENSLFVGSNFLSGIGAILLGTSLSGISITYLSASETSLAPTSINSFPATIDAWGHTHRRRAGLVQLQLNGWTDRQKDG